MRYFSTSSPTRLSAIRRPSDAPSRPAASSSDGSRHFERRTTRTGFDGYFGNHCADAEYPGSFAGFRFVDAYARAGSRFGPYWWWFNNGCTDWPVAEDRYGGPWETRTSKPVLVVGNYFDGVTGYNGARAANQQLRNSRLLSYAGWGHTAYGRNDCTSAHIDAYLVGGTLPRAGTVCRANPNPFLSVPVAKAAPSDHVAGAPPGWLLRPEP